MIGLKWSLVYFLRNKVFWVLPLGSPQYLWFRLLVSQVQWPVQKSSRNSKSFCWTNQQRILSAMESIILWFTPKNSGTRKYFSVVKIYENMRKILDFNHIETSKSVSLFLSNRSSHHTSLDQSSPPLGGTSPSCHYTLPSLIESKDDFPLRKTGLLTCTYKCNTYIRDRDRTSLLLLWVINIVSASLTLVSQRVSIPTEYFLLLLPLTC